MRETRDGSPSESRDPVLAMLDPASRSELARLARTPVGLAVLWGPQPDLVEAAAVALGGFWTPREHRDVDLVVCEADGRWTMSQLREQVLAAARVAALRRRVIVVCAAGDLERDGFDLLLKSVEEPPPGTHFLLTATDPARLPHTIVGRAAAVTGVRPLLGPARRDLLLAQGWDGAAADLALQLALPARWLVPVSGAPELLLTFGEIAGQLDASNGPGRAAASVAELVDGLTERAAAHFGSGDAGKRAARRTLSEWVLARLQERWREALWSGVDSASVGHRLEALSRARGQLAGNASLPLVLTALLSETATTKAPVPGRRV